MMKLIVVEIITFAPSRTIVVKGHPNQYINICAAHIMKDKMYVSKENVYADNTIKGVQL